MSEAAGPAAPRAPAQLTEVQVKVLAGAGAAIGAFVLFSMARIVFGRRQKPGGALAVGPAAKG